MKTCLRTTKNTTGFTVVGCFREAAASCTNYWFNGSSRRCVRCANDCRQIDALSPPQSGIRLTPRRHQAILHAGGARVSCQSPSSGFLDQQLLDDRGRPFANGPSKEWIRAASGPRDRNTALPACAKRSTAGWRWVRSLSKDAGRATRRPNSGNLFSGQNTKGEKDAR